jgi:hypothetical protein
VLPSPRSLLTIEKMSKINVALTDYWRNVLFEENSVYSRNRDFRGGSSGELPNADTGHGSRRGATPACWKRVANPAAHALPIVQRAPWTTACPSDWETGELGYDHLQLLRRRVPTGLEYPRGADHPRHGRALNPRSMGCNCA